MQKRLVSNLYMLITCTSSETELTVAWARFAFRLFELYRCFGMVRFLNGKILIPVSNSQTFPVKDVWAESVGTHLSDVRGFGGILKLLWNQTWPLFVPPHLGNTIKLCYLMFLLFSVGHGTFMW